MNILLKKGAKIEDDVLREIKGVLRTSLGNQYDDDSNLQDDNIIYCIEDGQVIGAATITYDEKRLIRINGEELKRYLK